MSAIHFKAPYIIISQTLWKIKSFIIKALGLKLYFEQQYQTSIDFEMQILLYRHIGQVIGRRKNCFLWYGNI